MAPKTMARPRRPLTDAERTRSCGLCGAKAGERCTNPDGSFYSGGVHADRRGGRTRRPYARDPHENYPVTLCGHCAHPGGGHIKGKGCRLCRDCPGWDEQNTAPGHWSDHMTDELLAAMEAGGPQ